MKKFILLCLVSLFVSCTNNEKILNETTETADLNMYDKSYIEKASLNEKLTYKRFHFKKITSWLLDNEKEVKKVLTDFNNYTNGEVDTFYAESVINQVLLEEDTSNDEDRLNNEIESKLEFSLNAFVDLEGESWYPSIRVHDFEKYLSRSPYDSTKTLYALDDYDEVNQEQIMVGYQENTDGELEVIDETLNEQLAGEDDIIVLELLPCSGGGGQQQFRSPCGDGGGGNPPIFQFNHHIEKMTVKYHKEGWPGRSEVNIVGFKAYGVPYENGPCGFNFWAKECFDYNGKMIERYHRSWINDQTERIQDFMLDKYDNPNNVDVYFCYVIFEQDGWPANIRERTFDFPNGVTRTVKFRSWQDFYDKKILKNKSNNQGIPVIFNYSVDINAIKYNFNNG